MVSLRLGYLKQNTVTPVGNCPAQGIGQVMGDPWQSLAGLDPVRSFPDGQ